jgi:antitoxin MazE
MKVTTIQKWGNSYAIRIPKETIDSLKLKMGQSVTLVESKVGKTLSLTPSKRDRSLKELLSTITPKNKHAETDWGPHIGNEVW